MKSNGGVLSADEVVHQPITTVLSGPAAGALGAALIAAHAGFDRILTLDGGGTSTDVAVVLAGEPAAHHRGRRRRLPLEDPDDRRRDGRRRRRLDRVAGARGHAQGRPALGRRRPGTGLLRHAAAPSPPSPTRTWSSAASRPHLLGGEIPLDRAAARAGLAALGGELGLTDEATAAGILEISAWNQANALRQVTVKRGLDVRDFLLTAFGGSGALLACRLVDILGLRGVLVPPNPGNVSAFGLLTVDVRNDYVQTYVRRHDRIDASQVGALYAELETQAAEALEAEGFSAPEQVFKRSADLRYFGQAYEVRVPVPGGDFGELEASWKPSTTAHESMYGYSFRGDERQTVEWVNLRVTGIGPIRRPTIAEVRRPGEESRIRSAFEPSGSTTDGPTPIYDRSTLLAGDRLTGPAIVQEFGSTVPVHPGFACAVDRWGNLLLTRGRPRVNPVLLEIVEGTLTSVEREVETAIARTSRSPMIRDAHDFRVGIHDAKLRKLTGRSYSALVHPVVRDYPITGMRPGDVFFHNDVYLSEGGIGHLPDLCVTVPVFHDGAVVAFVQAFGHHDDIGGACPGSMPSGARSVFEEGLMVPPIRLWDAGVPNEAALKIMTRNSRMPDSLAADLDAECSACLMGARRLGELFDRYGREPSNTASTPSWT